MIMESYFIFNKADNLKYSSFYCVFINPLIFICVSFTFDIFLMKSFIF